MPIERRPPASKGMLAASPIVVPGQTPFFSPALVESLDPKGEFEVLHVRLIRGQRVLVCGTAGEAHSITEMDNTCHIIIAEPGC